MRGLVLLSALCTACGVADSTHESAEGPHRGVFDPIGRIQDADVQVVEPAQIPDPIEPIEPVSPPRILAVQFEPVAHDADALRWTDIAFLPGPTSEFIAVDKDGHVYHLRLEGDGARTLGQFTLDQTWDDSDAGLISVTVDPNFETNGYFYVGLTTSQQRNLIQRHRLDPTDYAATRASAALVMEVEDRRAPRSWHNVGAIGFTDEGYLWALFGDKVLDDEAQNPGSPLGALVRIIPDPGPDGGHTLPPDNPFADTGGHPAVYAIGMRSPWKGTYYEGRWWFGDVGLDSYEEVNRIDAPGQNFGWPDIEGPCPSAGCGDTVAPWDVYGRGARDPYVRADIDATPARHRSVWVGPVYRGTGGDRYAGLLDEMLLFGDSFSGFVRARGIDDEQSVHVGHLWGLTAIAEGPDGYLYATALGTWPVDAPTVQSGLYRVVLDGEQSR